MAELFDGCRFKRIRLIELPQPVINQQPNNQTITHRTIKANECSQEMPASAKWLLQYRGAAIVYYALLYAVI